jgi:hypothetical protein
VQSKNRWASCAAIALAAAAAVPFTVRADGPSPIVPPVPAGVTPVAAPATEPADASDEIRILRARLDQLEAQQREAARKAEEQRTKNETLSDAERRSKMLDVGDFTAGYKDGRFFIGSEDGKFLFRPWFHTQFRYAALLRNDFKKGGTEDVVDTGFEVRRMRFGFDGNMFTPDFTYFFNWATVRASGNSNVVDSTGKKIGTTSNNLGGTPLLEEAWFKYNLHDTPWYVKAGQIKDPLLHDQIVSSRYQQSTERSLTADIFANGDAFTEGVTAIYDPKSWFRVEAGVTHGLRSANTNFLDPPQGNAFNYGVAGRAEFKLMGRWQDYAQIGAVDTKEDLLVVGVGVDYSERGHAGQTVGVVDAQYARPGGLNLYGAAVDRYTNHNFGIYTQSATGASIGTPDPKVADSSTNEYSFMLQAGYLINKNWEPFGRYEYIHLEGTPAGSHNYVQSIVGGVNYYFVGHRAKLTLQMNYLPHGIPIDDSPNDVFTNNGKGELLGEIQFQLLI